MKFSLETDDREEFEIMLKAREMQRSIYEIDNHLRSLIKHGNYSEEVSEILTQIRSMLPNVID